MAQRPSAAAIQPPVTVGSQKTNFANWLAAEKQSPGGGAAQELTIAGGVITPAEGASTFLRIDTEAAAASDVLDRIDPSNLPDGSLAFATSQDSARNVSLNHAAGGSGQMLMADATPFDLDSTYKVIVLALASGTWVEVFRGYGNDSAAIRSFLSLGTAATLNAGVSAGNLPTVSNLLGTVWAYTRQQYFVEAVLTDATTLAWDLDTHQDAIVVLGGSRTLANPSNPKDGANYSLHAFKSVSGAGLASYGSEFKWVDGVGPPDFDSIAVGQSFLLGFRRSVGIYLGSWVGPYSVL